MASPTFNGDESPGWPRIKRNRDVNYDWNNRYDGGTHTPGSGDDSNNGTSSTSNSSNFWSADSSSDAAKFKVEAVKYGRSWGFTVGHIGDQAGTSEHVWMRDVTGIEFDWNRSETDTDKNISRVKYMGLTYKKKGTNTLQYFPLIQNYNNVGTYEYKGNNLTNLVDNNGFRPSGSYSGRIAANKRSLIYNEKLLLVGFHIWWHQNGNQTIGKNQVMRMWNVRPLLGEGYVSSGFNALIPGHRYPLSEAEGNQSLMPLVKV